MADHDEIERLRDHLHELRIAVDKTGVTVAVLDERQKVQTATLARIEAALAKAADWADTHADRLTVLETRADEAKSTSAKYGASYGAAVGAAIAAAWQYFSHPK